ncbi:DUF7344 domain-containing protein [Halorussus sp. GCM10023401]|uniref:DUF7344 domain-containing protein n=1 Tax=Halorussus TaxID=1070314 RepID=UPI00361B531C
MNAAEHQTDGAAGLGSTNDDDDIDEPKALSKDEIFHLLQNQRRRDVLRYLQGVEGRVAMRDLAEQVAAWEHDTTLQALTSDECQRVYIALYQTHLPKLDEEGIIEYNQSRGIVERTPQADQLDKYLETDAGDDEDDREGVPWNSLRIGVSALGLVLFVGNALGLPVLAALTGFQVGVVVFALFTLVTAAEFVTDAGSSD